MTEYLDSKATSQDTDIPKPMSSGLLSFNSPLKEEELHELAQKNFSPETLKKVKWALKLFRDWCTYRNIQQGSECIVCDIEDINNIMKPGLAFALVQFLSKVKKLDGSEYHRKTLYDILICVQFHLESLGCAWKLLNEESFQDVKLTSDKKCTAEGIGISVKQAHILTAMDEKYLRSVGLLGVNSPE